MAQLSRRGFLGGASASFFALSSPTPSFARPRRRSPNEEVRIAVVGVRGRGRNHIDELNRLTDVRVVALVDVDSRVLDREKQRFVERGESVETYTDLRHALERDDIDAITVATPNHWHALQAIWACQAGKDVYLEKPVSHNIWEGGQIVRAARKYGRIVQTGTQSRSSSGIAGAIEWLHEGHLGGILLARGLCYKPRRSIGLVDGPQTVDPAIDYDLWTGPAPLHPLQRRQLHYDWHWDFETGCGDVGNQGIHQMDIARWALGEQSLPTRTLSIGGRLGYLDDGDTPNTQVIYHQYSSAPLLFEVRGLPRDAQAQEEDWGGRMDQHMGARIGVLVHCEGGYMRFPDYNQGIAFDNDGKELKRWKGASSHFANFLTAVRSRRVEDLNSDIREGHVSSAMCHMGNVSHKLGSVRGREEVTAALQNNFVAAEAWARMEAHLERNRVDLGVTPLYLGAALELDPATEQFVGNESARALERRTYREGFEVPEEV
jgi:predicted dehydrogenase